MTSKLVVNTIEADTGISSVSFASSISMSSTSKFHFSDAGIDIGADTNINRPATGVIGFNINSSEKLRISSNGQIGIGTDAPAHALDIQGSSGSFTKLALSNQTMNTSKYEIIFGDQGQVNHVVAANREITFATNGSSNERLRITSAGKVGIDTITPDAKLHVFSSNEAAIKIEDGSDHNNAPYLEIIGKRDDANVHQSFSGQVFLSRNRTTQKISSGLKLGTILFGGNHTNSSKSNIAYPASIAGMSSGDFNSLTDMPTDLVFFTGTAGRVPALANVSSGDERLRITSTGRINIGDGDQTQNVDQLSVAVSASNVLDNVARFQSTAAASGTSESLVKIYKGAGYGGVISGYITQGSDHGLKFYTANNGSLSERLRINSSGIIDSPSQAGFYARLNTNKNDKTGDGTYYTVQWDTDSGSICYDQNNTFSTSTGLYTIPTGGDGVYQFSTAVCLSTDCYGRQGEGWFVIGGLRVFFDRRYFQNTSGTITGFYGSCLIKMTAGQTVGVQVFVSGGSKNVDVLGAGAADHISWFSGRKIA